MIGIFNTNMQFLTNTVTDCDMATDFAVLVNNIYIHKLYIKINYTGKLNQFNHNKLYVYKLYINHR